jgi:hypothetical protein
MFTIIGTKCIYVVDKKDFLESDLEEFEVLQRVCIYVY